jgi:hypothetical protein
MLSSAQAALLPSVSAASLAADTDDVESVLSAPGNVEMPVSAAALALDPGTVLRSAASFVDRGDERNGGGGAAAGGRYRGGKTAGGLVSRYVAMFEPAAQPVISMPSWERSGLRGASTDLVLRFLNRHRRRSRAQRGAPAAEDAPSAQPAAPQQQPQQPHSYDSDSGSEEDADGEAGASRLYSVNSSPASSPPGSRRPSPLKTRSSATASPSRLGDAARAAIAAAASLPSGQLELPGPGRVALPTLGMSPPAIRTASQQPHPAPSIDLDNVRSNLAQGVGGALSPVILSPVASAALDHRSCPFPLRARPSALAAVLGDPAPLPPAACGPESTLAALEALADPAAQQLSSGGSSAVAAVLGPVLEHGQAAGEAAAAPKRDASPPRPPVHREPSDLHFAADTWLRALKAGEEAAAQARGPPMSNAPSGEVRMLHWATRPPFSCPALDEGGVLVMRPNMQHPGRRPGREACVYRA